jgi:hypothetical protein
MKDYILTIPRNHYDRLANAFDWDDTWFISFDAMSDTVKFKVTEEQRKKYARYAGATENRDVPKKYRATYLITQLFWPRNIKKYCEV